MFLLLAIACAARTELPASFPLPAPPDGHPLGAFEVTVAGVRTVTAQYAIAEEDGEALLELYRRRLEGQGLGVVAAEAPTGRTVTATSADGRRVVSATLGTEGGSAILTLVSLTR